VSVGTPYHAMMIRVVKFNILRTRLRVSSSRAEGPRYVQRPDFVYFSNVFFPSLYMSSDLTFVCWLCKPGSETKLISICN
jgi:hypothetical protein